MDKCENAEKDNEVDSYLIPASNGISPTQQLELKPLANEFTNLRNDAGSDSKKPLLDSRKPLGPAQRDRFEHNSENEYVGRDFSASS